MPRSVNILETLGKEPTETIPEWEAQMKQVEYETKEQKVRKA